MKCTMKVITGELCVQTHNVYQTIHQPAACQIPPHILTNPRLTRASHNLRYILVKSYINTSISPELSGCVIYFQSQLMVLSMAVYMTNIQNCFTKGMLYMIIQQPLITTICVNRFHQSKTGRLTMKTAYVMRNRSISLTDCNVKKSLAAKLSCLFLRKWSHYT